MKALTIITTFCFCFFMMTESNSINAQSTNLPDLAINKRTYHTAVGVRGGGTSGLTIKQFVGNQTALEGILGFSNHGVSATVLIEKHVPASEASGLMWYYGVGGHASFHAHHSFHPHHEHDHFHEDGVGLGVDGIIGIEYKIPPIPFAISLDLKPFVEVNTAGGVRGYIDPGLGVKVTF